MKTSFAALLLAVIVTSFIGRVQAQSSRVSWSVLGAGFSAASSGNTKLTSALGQAFVGDGSAGKEGIRSGFLAYPFRSPLSSGIQMSNGSGVPLSYALSQNYPNPFNPSTRIKYTVGGNGAGGLGNREVSLIVYDVLGRKVATLVDEVKAPGSYEVKFDAAGLASGLYIYRLTAGGFVQARKMTLVK